MKCPYRDFKECIVEQCPSCNYTEETTREIVGKYPAYMSVQKAIEEGYAYYNTKKIYKFVSCKLVESNVQPIPAQKQVINNTQKTNVVIRKSIF